MDGKKRLQDLNHRTALELIAERRSEIVIRYLESFKAVHHRLMSAQTQ